MSVDFSVFTESVIAAIGSNASPRVKAAFPIMIRKMHEFLIEADVTVEEWMAACNLLVKAGQVSTESRNEVVLVTDVFGIESLVDTLDQTRAQRNSRKRSASGSSSGDGGVSEHTLSAILGPFYRAGVPVQAFGTSIIRQREVGAPYVHLFGRVRNATGEPLANALIDIWHDAPDGLYDAQSPEKPEYHCRGRFMTDAEGRYDTVALRPTPYPIPYDHQAGTLLQLMDRHPYRPAHIHFWVEAEGYKTLVTQVFDSESKYIDDDSVFAVKDSLLVHFKPVSEQYQPPAEVEEPVKLELEQNFVLHTAHGEHEFEIDGPITHG